MTRNIKATSKSKKGLPKRRRAGWPKLPPPSPHVLYRCFGGPWDLYLLSLPMYQVSTLPFRIPSKPKHGTGFYRADVVSSKRLGAMAERIRYLPRTSAAWTDKYDMPSLRWVRV